MLEKDACHTVKKQRVLLLPFTLANVMTRDNMRDKTIQDGDSIMGHTGTRVCQSAALVGDFAESAGSVEM